MSIIESALKDVLSNNDDNINNPIIISTKNIVNKALVPDETDNEKVKLYIIHINMVKDHLIQSIIRIILIF